MTTLGKLADQGRFRLFLWRRIRPHFAGAHGIEIGGPSNPFKATGFMPVYSAARRVDVCNFSDRTIWEGTLASGFTFAPEGRTIGMQYVCEGSNLSILPEGSYDFVLSCHNLEHFANPLKAVSEWLRILKGDGVLLLVLPDPARTFDRGRDVTRFDHLLKDFEENVGEDDQTHVPEVVERTDFSVYPKNIAATTEEFAGLCRDNLNNRSMHHHVFDRDLLERIFDGFSLKTRFWAKVLPYHQVIVGQKTAKAAV